MLMFGFITEVGQKFAAWKSKKMVKLRTNQNDSNRSFPDSKVPGANTGPTWVLSAPDGPHVGPRNLAIRVVAWPMSLVKLRTNQYSRSMLPDYCHRLSCIPINATKTDVCCMTNVIEQIEHQSVPLKKYVAWILSLNELYTNSATKTEVCFAWPMSFVQLRTNQSHSNRSVWLDQSH